MTLPREHRGWSMSINCDWYGPEHWEAFHRDHEGTTLRAATEKDLMVEIDCWEAGQDDEDIAAIEKAAVALRSIANRHGLTYASIDHHTASYGPFWGAKGHMNRLAKSGHGRTVGDAIRAMIAREFFDTSTVEKAA